MKGVLDGCGVVPFFTVSKYETANTCTYIGIKKKAEIE